MLLLWGSASSDDNDVITLDSVVLQHHERQIAMPLIRRGGPLSRRLHSNYNEVIASQSAPSSFSPLRWGNERKQPRTETTPSTGNAVHLTSLLSLVS